MPLGCEDDPSTLVLGVFPCDALPSCTIGDAGQVCGQTCLTCQFCEKPAEIPEPFQSIVQWLEVDGSVIVYLDSLFDVAGFQAQVSCEIQGMLPLPFLKEEQIFNRKKISSHASKASSSQVETEMIRIYWLGYFVISIFPNGYFDSRWCFCSFFFFFLSPLPFRPWQGKSPFWMPFRASLVLYMKNKSSLSLLGKTESFSPFHCKVGNHMCISLLLRRQDLAWSDAWCQVLL